VSKEVSDRNGRIPVDVGIKVVERAITVTTMLGKIIPMMYDCLLLRTSTSNDITENGSEQHL
jgi:hypothetical protein